MVHRIIMLCLSVLSTATVHGISTENPRKTISLNEDWGYKPITNLNKRAPLFEVNLPHTWNAQYVNGTHAYNREMMVYRRPLDITPDMKDKRLFLYFEGVNSVANVFINKKTVGTHSGGYTAFCIEITDCVKDGSNEIEVWASNAYRTDVLPISGDFNVYGGIHRPCHLIITEKNCISPVFYASPGVFIHQDKISETKAEITVESKLSLKGLTSDLTLKTIISDKEGKVVTTKETTVSDESVKHAFEIHNPILWNGKKNPYLYTVTCELYDNNQLIDRVEQKTGFRYFSVDPDKGFFLNDKYLNLYGFCHHEDVAGKGSALTEDDYKRDMELIQESGATSLRLVHYPHAEPIYDLCDENGIVLWTEIAMCGPGGYDYAGYLRTNAFEENARQTLKELVYQKYNHPSVCFWGLFNEVRVDYDDAEPFVEELNTLYKEIDPTRLTTLASCVDQKYYKNSSDLIAWNKYYGWYGGNVAEAGPFFDGVKKGGKPVGVSEYGAGASIRQHQWPLDPKNKAAGTFHPEEWQNVYHEGSWESFAERPFMWGKYIWLLADFQSTFRTEGDTNGMNDKGLVSYDRQTKKDAFYFYKANWNPEPMLYISSRKFTERTEAETQVKVYSNLREATLYINDKEIGKLKRDKLNRMVWNVTLTPGDNHIRVEGKSGKERLTDRCTWTLK